MKLINRQGIEFLVHTDANDEIERFWNIDLWEHENYNFIKNISSKYSTFINAGGWIGPFTLFAAKLFPSVYSLEPDPLAFEELKRNIELNKFSNIKITNKALFDGTVKEITMGSDYSPLGRSGTSIFQKDKSVTTPCTTLKEFFIENNIPKQSFLMLDVEGAEYVLFDDIDFFKDYKPTILIEIHAQFLNDDNFNRLIKNLEKLKEIYDIPNIPRNQIYHRLFQPL